MERLADDLRADRGGFRGLDGCLALGGADGYICGAPELIAEIAASSVSYDLHQKKRPHPRAGVQEYLVWLADENRVIWWQLKDDEFVEIPADADGILTSALFPGLVIDSKALVAGDLAVALARLG